MGRLPNGESQYEAPHCVKPVMEGLRSGISWGHVTQRTSCDCLAAGGCRTGPCAAGRGPWSGPGSGWARTPGRRRPRRSGRASGGLGPSGPASRGGRTDRPQPGPGGRTDQVAQGRTWIGPADRQGARQPGRVWFAGRGGCGLGGGTRSAPGNRPTCYPGRHPSGAGAAAAIARGLGPASRATSAVDRGKPGRSVPERTQVRLGAAGPAQLGEPGGVGASARNRPESCKSYCGISPKARAIRVGCGPGPGTRNYPAAGNSIGASSCGPVIR